MSDSATIHTSVRRRDPARCHRRRELQNRVGGGLDALRLGLLALEVGDEVIVPANIYIATALAVSEVGGDVVLVDCDAAT